MDKLIVILEKGERSIQALIVAVTVIALVGMFLNHRVKMKALDIEIQKTKQELALNNTLKVMIALESSGRHDGCWGDGGAAYGWLQFHKATFYFYSKKYGLTGVDWQNKEDQFRLAYMMVRDGYGREWTVYKRAKKLVEF
jgi:hypothetical protein